MSYESIYKATQDAVLTNRLKAAVAREALANPEFGLTNVGLAVKMSGPDSVYSHFLWPLAIAVEADYEYALNQSNPEPGGAGVINDAAIGSSVQANWPRP